MSIKIRATLAVSRTVAFRKVHLRGYLPKSPSRFLAYRVWICRTVSAFGGAGLEMNRSVCFVQPDHLASAVPTCRKSPPWWRVPRIPPRRFVARATPSVATSLAREPPWCRELAQSARPGAAIAVRQAPLRPPPRHVSGREIFLSWSRPLYTPSKAPSTTMEGLKTAPQAQPADYDCTKLAWRQPLAVNCSTRRPPVRRAARSDRIPRAATAILNRLCNQKKKRRNKNA